MNTDRVNSQKNNAKKVLVGFDLGKYSVQISYMRPGMEAPLTAEQVIGSEVYNIPMVLYKRKGVNQWFCGKEALAFAQDGDGQLVDNLLQKAIDKETQIIEGTEVDGVALLTLFIKRSLSILGGAGSYISDLMFTCEELDDRVIEVMSRVAGALSLRNCNVYFQDYAESIYHYIIHQDEELFRHNVLCEYYDGSILTDYSFKRNLKTTPIVTFVEKSESTQMPLPGVVSEDAKPAAYERLDNLYRDNIEEVLGDELYSSVFLLGDGFKDEWYKTSVRVIARGRRVFLGNDLFSKGACYSLNDKYEPSETVSKHIYLGDDKLRSNVGMNVLRRGKPSYLALLDAGVNWYDVKCEYELFIPEDHILRFEIIPLDGSKHTQKELELINVPERDEDTIRILLQMKMSDINTIQVHLEDLGFGDIFPASGMEWDMTIDLTGAK